MRWSSVFLLWLLSTSQQFQTQSHFLNQSVHTNMLDKHLSELNKNQNTETVNQIYLNCGNEYMENVGKSK